MAKIYSQLATEIRTYLDEATQTDFLDTEVLLSANRAYHDVVGHVMEVYDRWYETTTPYTYAIVANQQEYTIASTLIKPTRVEINYQPTTSGSTASRAFPVDIDSVRSRLGDAGYGTLGAPQYYVHGNIGAQKLGFIPIPTIADTSGFSISVWGIDLPSDLSAVGDNVNIPYADRYAYLISLKAAAQLLRKGQQEENTAQNYINEYKQGILEMQTFLKDRVADDVQGITDVQSDNIDFGMPL